MHKRIPKIFLAPINSISANFQSQIDPILMKLYSQVEKGIINTSLTRINENDILTGFYFRSNGNTELFQRELNRDDIDAYSRKLRSGWRPSVYIYRSPLSPEKGQFICPDDEVGLAAYRKLKIKYIPCRILKPIADQRNIGEIWINCKDRKNITIARELAPIRDNTYAGWKAQRLDYCEVIYNISSQFKTLEDKIRDFHLIYEDEIHYNYMLAAVCRRHHQGLDAIATLIRSGYLEQSFAIVRMLYEQCINFNVDWLSPEFIGPRMQYFSYLLEGSLSGDKPPKADKDLGDFFELFKNTQRKANLTPHGGEFYDWIYRSLSFVVHQQYGNVEAQSLSFDENRNSPKIHRMSALCWIETISKSLKFMIENEIGLL